MTKAEESAEKDRCLAYLKARIQPEDQIWTVLKHVSRSGMQRQISVLIVSGSEIVNVSYYVAKALGRRMPKGHDSVIVNGCGMDMGYHLVYTLARVIFRDRETNENMKLHPTLMSECGYWLTQHWI